MAKGQDKRAGPENLEDTNTSKNSFNAGENSSDFDGGHPADGGSGSDSKVDKKKSTADNSKLSRQFNAGGNDSDFDGGQPKDGKQSSDSRIDTDK